MALEAACAVGELEEGVPLLAAIGNRRIALVLWRGEVFAVRDVCAHQNISFSCGRVEPKVGGTGVPGEITVAPDAPVLTCPRHGFAYDLRTGHCVGDPYFRIRRYPVEVNGGRVLVDVDGNAAERIQDEAR